MKGQLAKDVSDDLKRFQDALSAVEAAIQPLLGLTTRELEAQLEPRDRADAHVTVARAVDVLFRMQWRACGVDEDKREWKETDRIKRYQAKLKKLVDDEELASRRRTLTLNVGAANRFIDAAIPDLTEGQKSALKKGKSRQGPESIRSSKRVKQVEVKDPTAKAKEVVNEAKAFLDQMYT